MKKTVAYIILIFSVILLFGCGKNGYSPIKSTAEESKVVCTLTLEGKKYDVKYELYRALFLNYKNSVDLGDSSVWEGEKKDEYIEKINTIILSKASDIYSVLHFAEKLGFDPYSAETEENINEYIKLNVDGNGADVIGYGGDYGAYLESLKKMNMNYSVQVLLLRYSLMLEKINEYYLGTEDPALGKLPGEYEFTEEELRSYYDSEDCVRVLQGFIQRDSFDNSHERALNLKSSIENAENDLNAALSIINNTTASPAELIKDGEVSGIIIGKNTVTDPIYANYTDALFSIEVGEVSDVVYISGIDPGYFVIYKLEKTDAHFAAFHDSVADSYLNNLIGTELKALGASLEESADYTSAFDTLSYADISMD